MGSPTDTKFLSSRLLSILSMTARNNAVIECVKETPRKKKAVSTEIGELIRILVLLRDWNGAGPEAIGASSGPPDQLFLAHFCIRTNIV